MRLFYFNVYMPGSVASAGVVIVQARNEDQALDRAEEALFDEGQPGAELGECQDLADYGTAAVVWHE